MIIFDICSAITLGLGAASAASHVQRHLKLRSAAASIDASPRLGPTCWPFEIVREHFPGLFGRRQTGSDNRYRHSLTHPEH